VRVRLGIVSVVAATVSETVAAPEATELANVQAGPSDVVDVAMW
jgi:hypothetical protein